MKRVDVFSLVGEYGITVEDGQKIFTLIDPQLRTKDPVELDFTGVRVFASPFFNASFGRVLKDFTLSELRRLVRRVNLNAVGESVLERVLLNSEEYYRNPDARKALDDVLTSAPENDNADKNS